MDGALGLSLGASLGLILYDLLLHILEARTGVLMFGSNAVFLTLLLTVQLRQVDM